MSLSEDVAAAAGSQLERMAKEEQEREAAWERRHHNPRHRPCLECRSERTWTEQDEAIYKELRTQ